MKIAVEGCAHGELEKIYDVLSHLEKENNLKVDLLLICGDFQAVRNEGDLECMAVPFKYRQMQTFYKYYTGENIAPVLTVFVGGNHEASNYLSELNYGGWVCPNIYYLGKAGVIQVGGLRIAGMSGIYKFDSYLKGAYEIPPYDGGSLRSVYHVRNLEVYRLGLLKRPLDIMLSHDWPRGIYNHGNSRQLLRKKPFFKEEIDRGSLGSPPAEKLLNKLKPKYWFAAHLHCKFAALVDHKEEGSTTKFLALDKCLPRRRFLQILDIESPLSPGPPYKICHDLEWLAILRETDSLLNISKSFTALPPESSFDSFHQEISSKCQEVLELLKKSELISPLDSSESLEASANCYPIPTNFEISAKPYSGTKSTKHEKRDTQPSYLSPNNQTKSLCEALQITDPVEQLLQIHDVASSRVTLSSVSGLDDSQETGDESSKNPDEIDLDNDASDVSEDHRASEVSIEPLDSIQSDDDLDSQGDCKLFVIDRKPSTSTPFKRMTMSLPSPVNSGQMDDSGASTEMPDTSDALVKRLCTEETRDTLKDTSCGPSTPPTSGTFKRRNQAIYTTKNSDDDS